MIASEHLEVDLFDPQDIRAKLPEARRIYKAKREELAQLSEQVRRLGELVELLARVSGETAAGPSAGKVGDASEAKVAPGQERAAAALERVGRPMGPSALFKFMQDEQLDAPANANALGANLWAAAKAGRIKKVAGLSGLYAPLSWEPDAPIRDDEVAADDGTADDGTADDGVADDGTADDGVAAERAKPPEIPQFPGKSRE
ncbi:MAG TPA: hypothetical protein VES65_01555 [Solirubrobacteraceae bacterium]|nr:hypothetical protein [Solirubrobacteraceae bacterium]